MTPYCEGVLKPLARRILKTGVAVHHKLHTMIRNLLAALKDSTPTAQVVYQLWCHDWDASYIGETECPFKLGINEHQRDSSLVVGHAKEKRHSIDYG